MVEYPEAAGATEGWGCMAVVEGRLYRFGGHDGESYVGGGIGWLDVSSVWQHAEGGWVWEEITYQEGGVERAWWVLRRDRGEVSLGDRWRGEGAVVVGSVGYGCSGG